MSATPTQVDLSGFRSWFNDTDYVLQSKIDDMMKDPIFSLLGEYEGSGKSDTISVTGRANERFAQTKAEGAAINRVAPVEEDQLSKGYLTFAEQQSYSWESIVHDRYAFADSDPAEMVDNVLDGISLLFHGQLFNGSTGTSITLGGSHGAYDISIPDGGALFKATHSGPGYSSKSNIAGTQALSHENLVANIQHGNENLVTSTGKAISYNPDLLIVPNDARMVEKARTITGSQQVESSANNAINIFSGGTMKVVVLKNAPRSTSGAYDTSKQYHWMTADSNMLRKSVQYKFAARPQVLAKYMDAENADSYHSVLARVAVVAKRWQFGVLNNSTTAPTISS